MKRLCHVSTLLTNEWKSNNQEVHTQDEQQSEQSLQASAQNDVKTLIRRSDSLRYCEELKLIHQREVIYTVGYFTLLILIVLLIHVVTQRFGLSFVVSWTFTGSLLFLVFMRHFLCSKGSQIASYYVLSTIFLLISILYFMDNSLSKGPASDTSSGFVSWWNLHYIDFYFLVDLPYVLSHYLYLTAERSYFWILGFPCLFFFILVVIHSYMASFIFGSQALYFLGVTFFFTFITLFIGYLGKGSDKQLYATINALQESLSQSKMKEEKAVQALEQNNAEYEQKITHIKQFVSYLFHELRVPMNGLVLAIGHMLSGSLSDEQEEILKMMDVSSSSVMQILNEVLDMGKLESGRFQLEKQPFTMGELVSPLVRSYTKVFHANGIDFLIQVDDATKWLLSHHQLIGDKHRVRQVLANYLNNSSKFTHNGKVELRIVCNGTFTKDPSLLKQLEPIQLGGVQKCKFCSCDGNDEESTENLQTFVSITLSVEDTGIGINTEDKTRLFQPYTQFKAGSLQSGGGTGLGLCLCKMIVELAGGSVGVESDVGKGSKFSFTMPFELGKSLTGDSKAEINPFEIQLVRGDLVRSMSRKKIAVSSLSGDNPKVLIAEDNQVNRKILRKLLSSFGIDCEDAENGKQVVDFCHKGNSYDLILMDKEMPVMDGLEATRELRTMGIKVPIVGLTGYSFDSGRDNFLAAGVDDCFLKPISRHQLIRILEAHNILIK